MLEQLKTIAVTGANGFFGTYLCEYLRTHGFRVVELRFGAGENSPNRVVEFTLGEPINPKELTGIDLLVHAAYDFRPLEWDNICKANVKGSKLLLNTAREVGVKQILFISTMAAFNGCRSKYGMAKLLIEDAVIQQGGMAIRPGLMWGGGPGGLIGSLSDTIRKSKLVPLFGGGSQVMYLNHRADLSRFVAALASGEVKTVAEPFVLACKVPWTFRQILAAIATAHGKHPRFLPVPWQPVYVLLKGLEKVGLHPPFRSDSLLSLMNQDPLPNFSICRKLPFDFRDFDVEQLNQ